MIDTSALDRPAVAAPDAAPRADEPEHGGRLLLGWLLIVAAVVILFAGWLGVSANPNVAVQLSYFFSGGFGGLVAGVIGVGLLVSDDVRKDRARLGRLEATVLDLREVIVAQAETIQRLEHHLDRAARAEAPATKTRRRGSR